MNVTGGDMHYTMTLDYGQFEKSIKSAISDVNIMQNAVLGLAQGMATLASVEGIKAFASKAFEMRSFFQDAEAAMKVFLKSEDLAAEHLKELQSYAWYNVFEFTDLVTASRQLQAFGTEVEDVIPIIDKLSNIAAATNTPLENLVGMFNRAKNAGRLDSRGVMTLGNMGVNVKETLKEMGEQADITSISFEQLQRVIDHLTDKDAGGMFAGLMDEQFNNLSSLKGALEDSLDTLFADFGDDLQPLFEKILKDAQAFVAWLDEHRDTIEDVAKAITYLVGAYGIYRGVLALNTVYTRLATVGANTLGLSFSQLGKESVFAAAKVGALTTASKVLNATLSASVWTALIALVGKLTIELYNNSKAQHAVSDAAKEASKDVIASVEKERSEFNDLLDTLMSAEEGTDQYGRALDKLKKKYPEFIDNLNAEKLTLDEINEARTKGNELLDIELAKKVTAAQKEAAIDKRAEARTEAYQSIVEKLKKSGFSKGEAGRAANQLLNLANEIEYSNNQAVRGWLGIGSNDFWYKDRNKEQQRIKEVLEGIKQGGGGFNTYSLEKDLAIYRNIYDQSADLLESLGETEKDILADLENANKSLTSSAPITANPKVIADQIEAKQKEINDIRRRGAGERKQILDKEGNVVKEYEEAFTGLTAEEQEEIKSLQEDIKNLNSQYDTATGSKYTPKIATQLQQAKIAQQQAIDAMADGYAKTVAEINSKYEADIKQLEHDVNYVLTPGTDEHETAARELQAKQQQRGKELSDALKSYNAQKEEANRVLDQMNTDQQRAVEDRQYAIDALTVSLMEEGSGKEIAQMKLNHDRRMTELAREQADAIAQLVDSDKKEWEARQRAKGIDPNEGDFWAQYKGPSQEAVKAIQDYYAAILKGQEEAFANAQDDFWNQMLAKYGDYTAQKKSIDDKYLQDLNVATIGMMTATTEEEKKRYAELIKSIGKDKAKATLNLDLETIDTKAYKTVEDKMNAINEAYITYIENLDRAGASHEEITKATEEQTIATGKLATIQAKIAELSHKRDLAMAEGNFDEAYRLEKEINNLNAEVNSKSFQELWDEQKNSLVANSLDQVADAMARVAEATGNLNAEEAAQFMSSLSKGLKGFQQGAFLGLLIAGIEDTISQISDAIVKGESLEAALSNAMNDKWRRDMESMMEQGHSIFGDDYLSNINGAIAVMDEATTKLGKFGRTEQEFTDDFNRYLEATNLLSWRNWAMAFTETRNSVLTYMDALDKGYSKLEAHVLRTQDYGWLLNFFGIDDQYKNLKDMVEGLGYDLYDQYGNLNAEALKAILETYTDLSAADKDWIEKAISYSEEYQKAMESIAEYLESLFGGVADTIANQMIDSFLESGQAAMDFGAVVSDVAKNMSKDFIKNLLLTEVFKKYEEQMKEVMMSDRPLEEKQKLLLGYFAAMQADAEALEPAIQAYLEAMSQFYDAAEAESIGAGTALASASQESIDLLNGQLNAMRTVQTRMDGTINNILLELQGFRGDMNNQWNTNHSKLDQIIDNTSQINSGLGRSLGAYFGG